ncbi:MAG: hypothetical protein MUO26_09990 [Methanotrichaceae archaeon]|nr:hypothetical protein [Methanotrichaceae archaeon]
MRFNHVEGNVIIAALGEYDEYVLPRSMSRKVLYSLMRKFMDKLTIEIADDGSFSTPNLFHKEFDISKNIDIELDTDELDYINRAVMAGDYTEDRCGYPTHIKEAASNVYLMTNDALNGVSDITPENHKLYEAIFG